MTTQKDQRNHIGMLVALAVSWKTVLATASERDYIHRYLKNPYYWQYDSRKGEKDEHQIHQQNHICKYPCHIDS